MHVLVDDDVYEWAQHYRWNRVDGYVARYIPRPPGQGRAWPMHREIMGLEIGDPRVVHHLNENKLDNRRANLVVCASKREANSFPHPARDEAVRQAQARRTA